MTGIELEQIGAFGSPDRDPRERIISVAYFAAVPFEALSIASGSDAAAARLFPYQNLPQLAFDHADILATAHTRLMATLEKGKVDVAEFRDWAARQA